MRLILTSLFVPTLLLAHPLAAQQRDIVRTAREAGKFATLLAAVDAAELTGTLKSKGPFTVFAPTDDAFGKLPAGTVETLLKPENRDKLKAILLYHVVSGQVPASTARTLSSATTVEGRNIRIRTDGSALRINNATVIAADVGASNGVIHVIDQVLLPPESGASLDRMSERVATTSASRELIALAIRRAVPLYNDGQPEATSAIYEVAARAVVALGNEIPSRVRRRLEQGLRDAEREDASDERAWTLRRALDDAARGLAGREMTAARH